MNRGQYYEWIGSKESACNARDPSSTPGSGRSPGEWNDNPLQYCCLENSMDRGAWPATVMGSQRVGHDWATNTYTFTFHTWMQLFSDIRICEKNKQFYVRKLNTQNILMQLPFHLHDITYKGNQHLWRVRSVPGSITSIYRNDLTKSWEQPALFSF